MSCLQIPKETRVISFLRSKPKKDIESTCNEILPLLIDTFHLLTLVLLHTHGCSQRFFDVCTSQLQTILLHPRSRPKPRQEKYLYPNISYSPLKYQRPDCHIQQSNANHQRGVNKLLHSFHAKNVISKSSSSLILNDV